MWEENIQNVPFQIIIVLGYNIKQFYHLFISVEYQWRIVTSIKNMPNSLVMENLALFYIKPYKTNWKTKKMFYDLFGMSYLLNRFKFKSSCVIFAISNICNKYRKGLLWFSFIGILLNSIKEMFGSVIPYDETL